MKLTKDSSHLVEFIEKKTNKYIKLGTLDDYEKLVKVNDEHKPIHFLEYFLKTG